MTAAAAPEPPLHEQLAIRLSALTTEDLVRRILTVKLEGDIEAIEAGMAVWRATRLGPRAANVVPRTPVDVPVAGGRL